MIDGFTHTPGKRQADKARQPRRHWGVVFLVILYLALLIIPWVFISILSRGTLDGVPYDDEQGYLNDGNVYGARMAFRAANILNQFAALLTIPVTGAVIAQCVAIYAQRRSGGQSLKLGQTLGLADRGYLNPFVWTMRRFRSARSWPLLFAALFALLAFTVQILQRALVTASTVTAALCEDLPYDKKTHVSCANSEDTIPTRWNAFAGDRDVRDLCGVVSDTPTLDTLYTRFVAARQSDAHPTVWNRQFAYVGHGKTAYRTPPPANDTTFVTSVPYDLNTGALTYSAMRISTVVSCSDRAIPATNNGWPSCGGRQPFEAIYNGTYDNGATDASNAWIFRLCVSGDYTRSSWNITRGAQTLVEEMQVLLSLGNHANVSYTCTANSTLGEFELPNARNNYTFGPTAPPDRNSSAESCSSYWSGPNGNSKRSAEAEAEPRANDLERRVGFYSTTKGSTPVQGPLMLSMQSILGPTSFLGNAVNASRNASSPTSIALVSDYSRVDATFSNGGTAHFPLWDWWHSNRGNSTLSSDSTTVNSTGSYYNSILRGTAGGTSMRVAADFLSLMFGPHDSNVVADNLRAAVLYADEFLMSPASDNDYPKPGVGGGPIYNSVGVRITRPVITGGTAGIIAVAVLLGVQVLLLLLATAYAVHKRVWTRTLSAAALVAIGADLASRGVGVPPLGEHHATGFEHDEWLNKTSGVVGMETDGEGRQRLAVGGEGLVRRPGKEKGGEEGVGGQAASGQRGVVRGERSSGEESELKEQRCEVQI